MPRVIFAQALERHIACPPREAAGRTLREALEAAFAGDCRLRGYVLDDQGRLRQHMVVFVDGRPLTDRQQLSDPVSETSEIYVLQALSGG